MDAVILVALIMAGASIVVALINKAWVRSLHRDILVILHQTNSMQHEMQRLAKAEGKAEAEEEAEAEADRNT